MQMDPSNSCILGCFIFVTITVTEKNSRDANECENLCGLKKTNVSEHRHGALGWRTGALGWRTGALEWRTGALEWCGKAKGTPKFVQRQKL